MRIARARAGRSKIRLAGFLALAAVAYAAVPVCTARADPHSPPVQILSVRSYTTGSATTDFAQITTTNTTLCSGAAVYAISLASPAGQGMLAVAMTAASTGRSVTLEVSNSTTCSAAIGGAPQLQSLTLLANGYGGPF